MRERDMRDCQILAGVGGYIRPAAEQLCSDGAGPFGI